MARREIWVAVREGRAAAEIGGADWRLRGQTGKGKKNKSPKKNTERGEAKRSFKRMAWQSL